jgi:hypothetical protein
MQTKIYLRKNGNCCKDPENYENSKQNSLADLDGFQKHRKWHLKMAKLRVTRKNETTFPKTVDSYIKQNDAKDVI